VFIVKRNFAHLRKIMERWASLQFWDTRGRTPGDRRDVSRYFDRKNVHRFPFGEKLGNVSSIPVSSSDSSSRDRESTATPFFVSAGESAPAGIAVLVPVGSGPELSHKWTGPQRSCQACGTYRHELICDTESAPEKPGELGQTERSPTHPPSKK
jgi:hypothetical protein